MTTRRKLKAENKRLKEELAEVKLLLRAYMRSDREKQDVIDLLNASLDCTAAEMERWKEIAHKADERRKRYVLGNMVSRS